LYYKTNYLNEGEGMKKILMLMLGAFFLFASDVIKKDKECTINWTKYTLTCKGISASGQNRFAAILSAKVIAQRNMLEKIKGVRINSVTTFENGMEKSSIISSVVKGAIKGCKVVSEYYDPQGKYGEVEVQIDLVDDILIKILRADVSENILNKFLSPFFLYASTYSPNDIEVLKKLLDDFEKRGNNKAVAFIKKIIYKLKNEKVTGIVIDAKNVKNFNLSLMPKIRDANGKEIYPSNYVSDYEIVNAHGLVDYEIGTFEEVKSKKRVCNNPILIKAKSVYGNRTSDLVLNDVSEDILSKVDSYILQKAKIVILVDE